MVVPTVAAKVVAIVVVEGSASSRPSASTVATTFAATAVGTSVGTIVGSAVFNIVFVIGACSLASTCSLASARSLALSWWPLCRDVVFYCASLLCLIGCFVDRLIHWWWINPEKYETNSQ